MPKTQRVQKQLEFVDPTAMQWEELSMPVRARVRDHLARLLHHAAGQTAEPPEAGDDE
jgi:hypothetical protein